VTARDTIAAHGCWCGDDFGHDWPGKAEGEPHPSPHREFEALVQEAARRHREATDRAIEAAAEQAQALGCGVLVLTKSGVPWKCGPWPEVPAGEVHWRAA
jgi:hypothetical protein